MDLDLRSIYPKTAVILLAYGGPDSLEDVPAYVLDIRGGRETPRWLIEDVTERYRLIGGRSPLLGITRRVAQKLQKQIGLPVYVGMRHWHPYIADVVEQMSAEAFEHVVAICMAPHFSELSIGKYRQTIYQALEGHHLGLSFVDNWHTQPHYLRGLAANIKDALNLWPHQKQNDIKIVFTAHSLPESILDNGDPYDRQLRETAGLLAERISLTRDRWLFSYQSAPKTPIPWLGPQIEEVIVELAEKGHQDALIAPIGFVADHVEILYDLDIGVAQLAHKYGIRVERTRMLNDGAPLVDALEALVHAQLAPVPGAEKRQVNLHAD